MIVDILIFLIVGGLLFTVTTALHQPELSCGGDS